MKSFQVIVIILFILFALGGIVFFATFRDNESLADVDILIWGEENQALLNGFLSEFNKNTDNSFSLSYKEIKSEDFVATVTDAIASDRGPDIIILSTKDLLRFEDKLFPIPYESISERSFRDIFIEGGELFLAKEGILALPLSVNPLVMYWNRDMLQSSGLSSPPQFWSEFFLFAERLTEKDDALNINKSALAMGEYQNVQNAKEIILSLLLQNGNKVIERGSDLGPPRVVLNRSSEAGASSAESAIRFYTEFSNPTKITYSWNRSKNNSREEFISGNLALYFGLSGELREIREKNPNLNFDVAFFPQNSGSNAKNVASEIKGLAVLKRSKNINVALAVASSFASKENIASYAKITALPPVRRDLLGEPPGLAFEDLFYRSALVAKSFLDPDSLKTDAIFQNLIERIVSGRNRISDALSRAGAELNSLLVDN